MERVNLLLASSSYQEHLSKIEEREAERTFCKHGLNHFLEVARLSWIFLLEEGKVYGRDLVYAAALLHDIGRWQEYDGKGCHALLSAQLAEPLLINTGYLSWERTLLINAIKEHRKKEKEVFSSSLSKILSKADKYSRLCFKCQVRRDCYKHGKMPQNQQLFY